MVLSTDEKANVIKENQPHDKDTGSPEVQVAVLTRRINYLTQHLSAHKQDHHSRTGLLKLVGRRKKLLEYLKKQDIHRYENLIKKLKLRK